MVCGSASSCVERALEELPNIQQIVCSEATMAVLTGSGLVYRLSLTSDSQVRLCYCEPFGDVVLFIAKLALN